MCEKSPNETVPIRYLGTKKIESDGSLWDFQDPLTMILRA